VSGGLPLPSATGLGVGNQGLTASRDHDLTADAATHSSLPRDKYLCNDRWLDGYHGRWRYRVTEVRGTGAIGFKVLFRTRRDASTFSANCAAFGVQRAAQLLDASGFRQGVDLKLEPVATTSAETGRTPTNTPSASDGAGYGTASGSEGNLKPGRAQNDPQ
jgi:hypothetical protein